MKAKFLIYIVRQNHQRWFARCPATSKVSSAQHLREEAIGDLRKQLAQFLQSEGKNYLSAWKGKGEIINCPEGFIELPIDLWKCKLSGETCPIQAQIFITNKAKFLSGCLALEKRKEAIFETIGNSKYDGFHHLLGRYKCPLCKGKEVRRYYYPWELTSLNEFFDLFNTEVRIRFLKAHIDLAAYGCSLCPSHLKEVVSKIDLDMEKQLEIMELDFFR